MSEVLSESELKGRQYLTEAEKKMNSFKGLIGGLVGKTSTVEEAIELYIKAGNQFKRSQKWIVAGKAFTSAARLLSRSGEKHEMALNYILASNCFRKCDANEAIDCLLNAITFYEDLGRFGVCAKHEMTVADIYESQLRDTDKAVKHYEIAANHFAAEQSTASANKCLLNVANHLALQHNYQKAIDIYEQIGKHCIESPLLKYCANTHFFRAALCHSCIDLLNGELALKRYEEWFPAFGDSREYKLLKTMISKLEDQDMDGFTESVTVYDSISRFDRWFTAILLDIKRKYNSEDSELDMK